MNGRNFDAEVRALTSPGRMYRPSEVLHSLKDLSIKGVYGWWFKNMPATVPLDSTIQLARMRLLYVGTSSRALWKRLQEHVGHDSSKSTVRRSIGCLLAEELHLQFVVSRITRGTCCHFGLGAGEGCLSAWMEENARVSWIQHHEPFLLEDYLIKTLVLPMNMAGNDHPFARILHERRRNSSAGRGHSGRKHLLRREHRTSNEQAFHW